MAWLHLTVAIGKGLLARSERFLQNQFSNENYLVQMKESLLTLKVDAAVPLLKEPLPDSIDCKPLNCYDCWFAARNQMSCTWNVLKNVCEKVKEQQIIVNNDDHMLMCPLANQLCTSNSSQVKVLYGNTAKAMERDTLYFTIGLKSGTKMKDVIPRNYFCRWEVILNPLSKYEMRIERSREYENIEFLIDGTPFLNSDLRAATDLSIGPTSNKLEITATNLYNTYQNTFFMVLRETENHGSYLGNQANQGNQGSQDVNKGGSGSKVGLIVAVAIFLLLIAAAIVGYLIHRRRGESNVAND